MEQLREHVNSLQLQEKLKALVTQSSDARRLFADFVTFLNQTDEYVDGQISDLAQEIRALPNDDSADIHYRAMVETKCKLNGYKRACYAIKTIILNGSPY